MSKFLIRLFLVLSLAPIVVEAQITEIPFKVYNNKIFIDLLVNDSVPAKFIFDTGASENMIDEKLLLHSNNGHAVSITGVAGYKRFEKITDQKLTINNISLFYQDFVLFSFKRLENIVGTKIDGAIGFSLLNKYITEINYTQRKILLYEKIEDVDTKNYYKIPFQFDEDYNLPLIKIIITPNEFSQPIERLVVFDSGANCSFLANSNFDKNHNIAYQFDRSIILKHQGAVAEFLIYEVVFKNIRIGKYNLNCIPVGITFSEAGIISEKNNLGILGAKVISRFDVIIDCCKGNIYLKPNEKYNEPFNFPLCGFQLYKKNDRIFIYHVDSNSVAYNKGVRTGDEVIAINQIYRARIEVYRDILKKEGHCANIMLRGKRGKQKNILIKLKKVI